MGALADAARKNSNFLIINKGESVEVTYLSFRLIPSTMDPTKESAQYKFATSHGEKYWTNGNGKIMNFFDELPSGTKVRITRNKSIRKDGSEEKDKSTYVVEEVKETVATNKSTKTTTLTDAKTGQLVDPVKDIVWKD